MSTITKQAVQAVADLKAGYTLSHADVAILNELARIALASLEAEKEYKHHSVIAEQLAHVLSSMDATDHQRAVISCAVDRLNKVSQLLQFSPSALLVPEMLDYQGAKELYNYLMTEEETNATVNGWNACRAAMLQGADGTLTNEDTKRVDELVMWIKRLAHSLRKANPDSKLQSDVMDYLSRKGLIGVEDILR